MSILFIAMIIILTLILVMIILLLKSKNIYIRLQNVNVINSLSVILIALYCYYIDKPEYIDLALLYATLSFLTMLGLRKYFNDYALKGKDN